MSVREKPPSYVKRDSSKLIHAQQVLTKGDVGKSGATASSFEHVQEKTSDEVLKRLRDIKDQVLGWRAQCLGCRVEVLVLKRARHINDQVLGFKMTCIYCISYEIK